MREFFFENSRILKSCSLLNNKSGKKSNCSAVAKTFIEVKEILNLVSRYAQIPDKQNYLQEVGGIKKL